MRRIACHASPHNREYRGSLPPDSLDYSITLRIRFQLRLHGPSYVALSYDGHVAMALSASRSTRSHSPFALSRAFICPQAGTISWGNVSRTVSTNPRSDVDIGVLLTAGAPALSSPMHVSRWTTARGASDPTAHTGTKQFSGQNISL